MVLRNSGHPACIIDLYSYCLLRLLRLKKINISGHTAGFGFLLVKKDAAMYCLSIPTGILQGGF